MVLPRSQRVSSVPLACIKNGVVLRYAERVLLGTRVLMEFHPFLYPVLVNETLRNLNDVHFAVTFFKRLRN